MILATESVVIEVSAYDAKAHLSGLLHQVEEGETVVITRHGHPVARLMPLTGGRNDVEGATAELRLFRRGRRLGEIAVRELIEDGRP